MYKISLRFSTFAIGIPLEEPLRNLEQVMCRFLVFEKRYVYLLLFQAVVLKH